METCNILFYRVYLPLKVLGDSIKETLVCKLTQEFMSALEHFLRMRFPYSAPTPVPSISIMNVVSECIRKKINHISNGLTSKKLNTVIDIMIDKAQKDAEKIIEHNSLLSQLGYYCFPDPLDYFKVLLFAGIIQIDKAHDEITATNLFYNTEPTEPTEENLQAALDELTSDGKEHIENFKYINKAYVDAFTFLTGSFPIHCAPPKTQGGKRNTRHKNTRKRKNKRSNRKYSRRR